MVSIETRVGAQETPFGGQKLFIPYMAFTAKTLRSEGFIPFGTRRRCLLVAPEDELQHLGLTPIIHNPFFNIREGDKPAILRASYLSLVAAEKTNGYLKFVLEAGSDQSDNPFQTPLDFAWLYKIPQSQAVLRAVFERIESVGAPYVISPHYKDQISARLLRKILGAADTTLDVIQAALEGGYFPRDYGLYGRHHKFVCFENEAGLRESHNAAIKPGYLLLAT